VSNATILTLPAVERAQKLYDECVQTRALGVIVGMNGTGKTSALKSIAGRHTAESKPGVCLYYRCARNSGPTRGLKDILQELGCRDTLFRHGASVQMLVKFAQRELRKRDVRAILLDEADEWALDALGGFVTLFDVLRETDTPVAAVLAGVKAPSTWIGAIPSGDSRTLRVEQFSNLTPGMMLGILKKWLPTFEALAEEYEAKNAQTRKLVTAIAKVTSGNLRRLRFFADLAEGLPIEQIRDPQALDAILLKLTMAPGTK
jgi:hypothetical protein